MKILVVFRGQGLRLRVGSEGFRRFRGGLVLQAQRLYVSLNSRLERNKKEEGGRERPSLLPETSWCRELTSTRPPAVCASTCRRQRGERELFIDNLLVRIHFIIVMIRWIGLASRHGSLNSLFQVAFASTFLGRRENVSFSCRLLRGRE